MRRLISLVFVLFGMTVITFTLSHVVPADPAAAAAGLNAGALEINTIRERMGLDRPLYQQYVLYMEGLILRGDLGRSIASNLPVQDDLVRYLPASLELAVFTILLYLPTGLVLGVLSARAAGGVVDAATRGLAILGLSVPVFWLGLIAQLVFYGWLGVLPATGRIGSTFGPPPEVTGFFTVDALLAGNVAAFADALRHLILPGVVLALGNLTVVTRMTRSSVLEVLSQDFVRTARAKGLRERTVITRHVLRNAMLPIVTVIALQMAALIAWQFLVETIFSWPGIGSWAVNSIMTLDFNAVMAVTLFGSVLYVALNFLADVSYLLFDPRIRY
ncbi:MAG TPA: ABC transporter permease [Candidatus Limnocylindria bacterium]|jgi:peptide/nickel transport system permease protein|nr:ABC transporter permease [Candidatus Limnocylindria bacterium]